MSLIIRQTGVCRNVKPFYFTKKQGFIQRHRSADAKISLFFANGLPGIKKGSPENQKSPFYIAGKGISLFLPPYTFTKDDAWS
jgi:hypothetical protein